jgi:hypothetical protein
MGRGGAWGAGGEGRSMDGMAPELKGREPEVSWILNHRGGNELRLL